MAQDSDKSHLDGTILEMTLAAKLAYCALVLLALVALLVAFVEALPGIFQLAVWGVKFAFSILAGRESESIFDVARSDLDYAWLSFHRLPSGLAFPVAVGLLVLCFHLFELVAKVDYSFRQRRGMLTEKELLDLVAARKKHAEDREIAERVAQIVRHLGISGSYLEENLRLANFFDRVVVAVREDKEGKDFWREVFEASYSPGGESVSKRTFLQPDTGRARLEIKTEVDTFFYSGCYSVKSYIPGDWEKRVYALDALAEERKKWADEEAERVKKASEKAELEEQRRRFGV